MKFHLHVAGKRVFTCDVGPKPKHRTVDGDREDLEAFINALMAAIARAEGRTADEEEGHPFHGNQYTEVAGQGKEDEPKPKPTAATPGKGVKAATHELLSSGHPFTIEELMKATGAKTASTLTTALADLKNPKYAGSLGALQINKLASGHFQIVKGSKPAEPWKPDPDVAKVIKNIAKPMAKADKEMPLENAVKAAQPFKPDPTPPEHPYSLTTHALKAQPKTSGAIPQGQASTIYENGLLETFNAIIKDLDAHGDLPSTALKWKQAKTNLMAQYSAHVTGNPASAKQLTPADVFPEDLEFAKKIDKLVKGGTPDVHEFVNAYQQWKADTQKAKAAPKKGPTPTPASKPAASPAAAPTKVVATPKGETSLPKPAAIVPTGFKTVSSSDFKSGKFEQGMSKLYTDLQKGHPNSVENKKTIQARLTDRLKDSKTWAWLKTKAVNCNYNSLEAHFISAWASTSGDGHPVSCALQLAARDAFDMDPKHVAMNALKHVKDHGEDETHRKAASALGLKLETPEDHKAWKSALQDFTLAQYHDTQDHLKALGVDHVYVARGMKAAAGHEKDQKVKLKLQPASSFSANYSTAKGFSGGHSIFLVKVPREQVLSSYVTGYGCTNEHEVVVLAHPDTEAVHISAEAASQLSTAVKHVNAKVTKWA